MPERRRTKVNGRPKKRERQLAAKTRYTKDRQARQEEYQQMMADPEARRRLKEKEEARKRLEERRKRKEKNIREMKEASANRVSYVRKPLAKNSFWAAGFLAASLVFGGLGIYGGVVTRGQAALSSAALGLCSIVLAAVSVWYGGISFLEKEKNYILARIVIVIGGAVLIGWAFAIILGMGG